MKVVRIANSSGYWGDDPEALYRQVTGGEVDYVTGDYLAEITMVILERQRRANPSRGYAYDFIGHLRRALPEIARRGIRVVVNAGGVNPEACRDAITELCRGAGVSIPIAVVDGGDLLPRVNAAPRAGRLVSPSRYRRGFRDDRRSSGERARLPRGAADRRGARPRRADRPHHARDRRRRRARPDDPRVRLERDRLGPARRRHGRRSHPRVRRAGDGRQLHRLPRSAAVEREGLVRLPDRRDRREW